MELKKDSFIKIYFYKYVPEKSVIRNIKQKHEKCKIIITKNIRTLFDSNGKRIIVSINDKKINNKLLPLTGKSRVILISDKIKIEQYRDLILKGFYDIARSSADDFNEKLFTLINRSILEYDKIEKDNLISKGLYFANVIHELRSPLNSIIGYTSMLFENETDQQKKSTEDIVLSSSKYMLGIINDTLDFTKLQSGKMELLPINFILRNTIEHIVNIFDIKAKEKNINFLSNISIDCPLIINGDELRFSQILINLLSNAFKFTPEYGTIKLSAMYNDGLLILQISDNGAGINKNDIDKIFLPFEQSSEKETHKYGGTGLGLAITKDIVQLMNGIITVESELKHGTTFTISLPFEKTETVAIDIEKDDIMVMRWLQKMGPNEKLRNLVLSGLSILPDRIASLEDTIKQNNIDNIKFAVHKLKGFTGSYGFTEIYDFLKRADIEIKNGNYTESLGEQLLQDLYELLGMIPDKYFIKGEIGETVSTDTNNHKVLYVDDLIENRDLMKYYMEQLSFQCDIADGYKQAIELYRNRKYSIVILDLQMPEVTGFELLKMLKKIDDTPYFMAATGDTDEFIVQKIKYAGFNSYLFKPLSEETLKNELKKITL